MMIEVIRNTLMITGFVLAMMMLLEYFTILTKGKWSIPFERSEWLQIILATILGAIPGCLGLYTVVSLYIHRTFRFAALISATIASLGDESYILISTSPLTAVKLYIILITFAILVGFLVSFFAKNKTLISHLHSHREFHEHEEMCFGFKWSIIVPQLKNITFYRAILMGGIVLFIVALLSGMLNHEHHGLIEGMVGDGMKMPHNDHHSGGWDWLNLSVLITCIIAFFIVSTAPDHYLEHHLWEHLLKKHFLKIFLWTFGALIVIHYGIAMFNIDNWLQSNLLLTLIIAILIGIIPESGPHIIFITLFVGGMIPFSVLLSNSIVQDGHGGLPLLAESKKSFLFIKGIKIILALIVGFSGWYFGF